MARFVAAGVAAVSVLMLAGNAWSGVIVAGRSLAGVCSRAAIGGARDIKTLDLCTRALEEEALVGRNLAATRVNRGVIQVRRGALTHAVRDFEAAIEADPTLGEGYVNRGSMRIVEGRLEEGLQDTERGLALGLERPERAYFNRAVARELLYDDKGAYFDYRKAAELAPRWELPRQQLARFTVIRAER